jgi:hypothetical protein
MSVSGLSCHSVQIGVLITCVSFTVMSECIKITLAHTGGKRVTASAIKWTHLLGLCLLVSMLIKGFAQKQDVSSYLLSSSVGFCSYSLNYLRYLLLHIDPVSREPILLWQPLHIYFYLISLACNIFACVYVQMNWSYIGIIFYRHLNDACFFVWSVVGLAYSILCTRIQCVRPSLASQMLTKSVFRQTLSFVWCILQVTVITLSVTDRFVTHAPEHVLMLSYLSCFLITQWIICHARDQLSHTVVIHKDTSYCNVCTLVVEVDPMNSTAFD